MNSHLLALFISYRSSGEKLMKYQGNSSCLIVSVILMTTVFYKAVILQQESWCWSFLGLKGLTVTGTLLSWPRGVDEFNITLLSSFGKKLSQVSFLFLCRLRWLKIMYSKKVWSLTLLRQHKNKYSSTHKNERINFRLNTYH